MIGLLILFGVAAGLIIAAGTLAIIHQIRHPPKVGFAVAISRKLPVEPADLRLSSASVVFRLPDGATTPGWVIEGLDRSPGAPVVVFTHGWGDSRIGSLAWAELLAPLVSAFVAYDLRGHGESSARKSDVGTTEITDLLAIAGQLNTPADQPIVLMGASIGAGISIAAAAAQAERGRPPGSSPVIRGVIGEGVYRRGMEPIYGFLRINRWPTFPFVMLVGWHLAFWLQRDSQFERARHAAKLRCPLLLLHGTDDPICRYRSAQEIAAAAPDAKLVTFEGGSHLDLASLDRARYVDAVAAFLTRVRSNAAPANTGRPHEPAPTQPETAR